MWVYLIDTNVVSELSKPDPDPTAAAWMAQTEPVECCLSLLTLAELERGVVLLEAKGAVTKARRIRQWLTTVEDDYAGRILPVTAPVTHAWANLPTNRTFPGIDSLIAATAIAHNLTVVTRNTKDFAATGARCLDPFQPAPQPAQDNRAP